MNQTPSAADKHVCSTDLLGRIEKGVPLAPKSYIPRKHPAPLLQVGESFLVPLGANESIEKLRHRMNCYAHGMRKLFPERSFAVRTVADGVRVWRTA